MLKNILFLIIIFTLGASLFYFINKPTSTPLSIDPIPISDDTKIYQDETSGFTVHYPKTWDLDTDYKYSNLGPEEPTIPGVKFHIPTSLATGTNLSAFDTGLSIETMPGMPSCTAYPFLIQPGQVTTAILNGVEYSIATTSGAGAGNFYEEQVFARTDTNPCLAVRYFIHSTNFQNYPEGTVVEFNKDTLLQDFDKIRDSLTITK